MKSILSLILSCLLIPAFAQLTCEDAMEVGVGQHQAGEVLGEMPTLICTINGTDNLSAGLWYTYTAEEDQTVTVSTSLTENEGRDTRVHIYSGTCGDFVCVGGDDDDGAGYLSIVDFVLLEGEEVYIVFDDRWDDLAFVFDISISPYVAPPVSFTVSPISTSGNVEGVVDMNGDYKDDMVAIPWSTGSIYINYQTAAGFTQADIGNPAPMYYPSWSLTAGDLDANGINDLIFGGGQGVSFMFANEDGSAFTEVSGPEYVFSQRGNCIDIDNDGNLDMFMCHDVEPNVYYMNDGENNFVHNQGGIGDFPTGGNYGSIWIDYDLDGNTDLFIAKCRGGGSDAKINELHKNNGDGTFTLVSPELDLDDPVQTWSSAWGDFDNDGDFDVFIGASSFSDGEHKLLENNGDGTFTDITAGSGIDLVASVGRENVTRDFDNDGFLDLLGAGGKLMINNGDMTFSVADIPFTNGPIGDLNDDGFLDVVNNQQLYLNNGNENGYLVITAVGTESNLSGIGSVITVHAGEDTFMRQVQAGDGFAYMSSLNAYFGLGQHETVDSIMVNWPSGNVDVILEPAINQHLIVTEGSSPLSVEDELAIELLVYPNPTDEMLFVDVPFTFAKMTYSVFDLSGKMVDQGIVNRNSLNVSDLTTGAYILSINVDGKQVAKKFFKE